MFDFITSWINQGGLPMVAFLMFLENVFPPIPSELVMPLAGFNAAKGEMSMLGVIVAGTLGSVLGCTIWYGLARAWGRERFLRFIDRHGIWLTLDREEAERAMAWFDRHGRSAVFFGRMVPTVRTLISVPAGLSGMGLGPFLIYTTAGGAIWTAFLALSGYLLREGYDRVEGWINPVTNIVVAVVVIVYAYRLVRGFRRRRAG